MKGFGRNLLDRPVHAFHLTIVSGMAGPCQPMLDVLLITEGIEGMMPDGARLLPFLAN